MPPAFDDVDDLRDRRRDPADPGRPERSRVTLSDYPCRTRSNCCFCWRSSWSAAKLAGAAANRIGQPAVFGEILIGLLLGPTVLDILGWPIFATPGAVGQRHRTARSSRTVRDLAELGVILLMFIAGLETDLDEMRRVGRVAFWSAAGGVVLPLLGGTRWSRLPSALAFSGEGIFIGTILTATSVSISAQTLIELGALKSKEGSTILGAAVIDDVMGIVVLSIVVALARAGGEVGPRRASPHDRVRIDRVLRGGRSSLAARFLERSRGSPSVSR